MRKPILPKQSFRIQHLDRFFQGVSKDQEQISFIQRALPEEEGNALITRRKKKVQFGEIAELSKASPKRLQAECPHYDNCSGCQTLHMSYQDEKTFKQETFERFLGPYLNGNTKVISGKRFHYRNRVQLQYDRDQKTLGFKKSDSTLAPIENCLLMNPAVAEHFSKLNLDELPLKKKRGHIEIYQYKDEVFTNIDKPYAYQGFTQVNTELNKDLIEKLNTELSQLFSPQSTKVLDLFGGAGNLSQFFQKNRKVIDIGERSFAEYLQLDLYKEESLYNLKKVYSEQPDLVIVNPPRNGFKFLNQYIQALRPKYLLYMSCDIATLKRDLDSLQGDFKILENWLVDFFPGTYHFESLVLIEL